jgi:hypothetical protein
VSNGDVRIGREEAYLALSREPLYGLRARLVLPNLHAETQVSLTDPALEVSLAPLVSELAADWRGWDGLREWATYERGLVLRFDHDGLGHVGVAVELREYSGSGWRVRGDVSVDAGQLDRLAHDIAELFGEQS